MTGLKQFFNDSANWTKSLKTTKKNLRLKTTSSRNQKNRKHYWETVTLLKKKKKKTIVEIIFDFFNFNFKEDKKNQQNIKHLFGRESIGCSVLVNTVVVGKDFYLVFLEFHLDSINI